MLSIKDVIKDSISKPIFDSVAEITMMDILSALALSAVIGILIYLIYKSSSKTAFYSKDTAVTIAAISVVVSGIILAMQANLIVSLGMVGALSIVRFRTAVKNPLDLLYLFWSISEGIICGVGLKKLALLIFAVMACLVIFLQLIPGTTAPSILVLRSDERISDTSFIETILKKSASRIKLKSRSLEGGSSEFIYELKIKDRDSLINDLNEPGIFSGINVLSHDGESRV